MDVLKKIKSKKIMTYKIHICEIDPNKIVNDRSYQSEIRGAFFNKVGIELDIDSYFGECWIHQENDLRSMELHECEEFLGNEFTDAFNEVSPDDINDKNSWFYNSKIDLYHLEHHGAILHASDDMTWSI